MDTLYPTFRPSRMWLLLISVIDIVTVLLLFLKWDLRAEVNMFETILDIFISLLLGICTWLLWTSKVVVREDGLFLRPCFPPVSIFILWRAIKKVDISPAKYGQVAIVVTYLDDNNIMRERKIGVEKTSDLSALNKYIPENISIHY